MMVSFALGKRESVELDAQGRSVEPLEEEKISGVRRTGRMRMCVEVNSPTKGRDEGRRGLGGKRGWS